MNEQEKEELLRQRAIEHFNNPANFETDLSKEILENLEGMLEDTHPSTIEKLHMAIMQLIIDNTDYQE